MDEKSETAGLIREELAHSDSVLMPESTLRFLLGNRPGDLRNEVAELARDNGWLARQTSDGQWLFERNAC